MKNFLNKAKEFIFGLFGLLIAIFGIFAYFRKDILDGDDKIAEQVKDIDKQISDKSEPVKVEDLSDSELEDYWSEK